MAKQRKHYRDFDNFVSEAEAAQIEFRVCGRDYKIPASPRLSVALRVISLMKERGEDAIMTPTEVIDIAECLIGKANFEQMTADGVTMEQLGELIGWLWQVVNGGSTNDDDAEDSPAVQQETEQESQPPAQSA